MIQDNMIKTSVVSQSRPNRTTMLSARKLLPRGPYSPKLIDANSLYVQAMKTVSPRFNLSSLKQVCKEMDIQIKTAIKSSSTGRADSIQIRGN